MEENTEEQMENMTETETETETELYAEAEEESKIAPNNLLKLLGTTTTTTKAPAKIAPNNLLKLLGSTTTTAKAPAKIAPIATTPVVAQGPQHLVKINESLVSQSSPYSNNRFPATNAFHNKFTHTNKGKGMWWKVKFPVKYNFSKIRIKNRANCCPERLDLTKVYVSGKLCGTIPKGTKKNTWYEVTCNLTGNEIKLVTTQNTYLSIQGFEAYAGAAAIAIPTPVVDPIPQILVINKPKPVAQILVINKPAVLPVVSTPAAVLPVVSTPAPSPTPAFGGFYKIEFFTAAQGLIDIETLRN